MKKLIVLIVLLMSLNVLATVEPNKVPFTFDPNKIAPGTYIAGYTTILDGVLLSVPIDTWDVEGDKCVLTAVAPVPTGLEFNNNKVLWRPSVLGVYYLYIKITDSPPALYTPETSVGTFIIKVTARGKNSTPRVGWNRS